ncbi:MAG TPA: tRNA (N6-threonylcarbamoyladenosine(37)-N6)-methyltransferase TrmO [Ktedonobacterales bacterium]|jgi:tRNA-Thr(GGU) m(6)t(6)A37 methyltransferase TsaA
MTPAEILEELKRLPATERLSIIEEALHLTREEMQQGGPFQLQPIGIVKSPISEEVVENWGEVVSEIVLNEAFAPGLQGLEQFSHVMVIFYMHQAHFDLARDLVRRPRGRDDMPSLGIFAQRPKLHPNPIGITAVQFVEVTGNILKVKGLDAINDTPVLDLKPYFPIFDRVDNARTPEWVDRLLQGYF